ncbi:MAG TPA: VCBS repeat-containing protein, partial [Isosphaeraceae bacterium]|nr:VCBS repeat-containing protein [Isosphaeraceae bacterium]
MAMIGQESGLQFQQSLFVDAISGQDGRRFWWWRRETSREGDKVESLRWWGPGPDGWPRLMVTLLKWPDRPSSILMLSSGTGELVQELPDAFAPHPADLDGDGVLDLIYSTTDSGNVHMGNYRLHALRGQPPVAWARLGLFEPVADLNADGLEDLVEPANNGLTAISGHDGQVLWATDVTSRSDKLQGRWSLVPGTGGNRRDSGESADRGDLDGDGTPDLLVGLQDGYAYNNFEIEKTPLPLRALSGRTGEPIWSARNLLAVGHPLRGTVVLPERACFVDLDADGIQDVAAIANAAPSGVPSRSQLGLYGLSGRDGSLIWKQPLTEGTGSSGIGSHQALRPPMQVGNLDGDAVPDFVVAIPSPVSGSTFRVDLLAFRGRDGHPLWSRSLGDRSPRGGRPESAVPDLTVEDLNGDGTPEVVVVDHVSEVQIATARQIRTENFEVQVLDGRSGEPRGEPWRFGDSRGSFEMPPSPVLVDFQGEGHRAIALLLREDPKARLVLLDDRGQVQQDLAFPNVWPLPSMTPFACDLDGDGDEELAVAILRNLSCLVQVFDGDLNHPLWSRTLVGAGRITEVIAGSAGQPGSVVFGGPNKTAIGLDGKTGEDRWRGQSREQDAGVIIG